MSNRTRQVASYPRTLFLASRHLRRRIEEHQDELVFNADALNAVLVELERIEVVLGVDGITSTDSKFSFQAIFGDGSDLNITLATGSTTNLTRDMYYNNLTLEGTALIETNGWRIFVRDTLTVAEDTTIAANGGAAVAEAQGIGYGSANRSLGFGPNGGAGNIAAGTNGASSTGIGGAGGDGGAGSVGAAGTGGAITGPTDPLGLHDIIPVTTMISDATGNAIHLGGAGGGGGGGDGSADEGGGGGGGAGVIMIAAQRIRAFYSSIVNKQPFHAEGGDAADGTATDCGGGGGGGGGVIAIMSHIIENTEPVSVASPAVIPANVLMNISGGALGASGGGGGSGGAAGSAGTRFDIRI